MSTLAVFLLLSVVACDYTGSQGGTLSVHLSSSDSDLKKAVVTVERVSVSFAREEGKDFERRPNLITGSTDVELTAFEGAADTLLSRDKVLPAEFNQLHVVLSDTARIAYRDGKGGITETKVALAEESLGKVALPFGKMRLMKMNETAKIKIGVNLDRTFVKTGDESAYQFKPDIVVEQITVDGRQLEQSR